MTNQSSVTAAIAVASTIVCESNQSSRWPRSSTNCSEPRPAVSSASPSQSIGEVSRAM
jgi:hypothetical protein